MTESTIDFTLPLSRTGDPLIQLRGVSRQFGQQEVLRQVSLSVYAGETLAVIGESGCGKSVTLKLIMALLQPTSGTVCWEGRPVSARSLAEQDEDRLKFGYVFQGAALFDSLDVYENIAFGLRENRALSEREVREIVRARLIEVGLSEQVCSKKPAELSGGMRKRVGLARALALEPEIMLYDEPTTGLDPIMTGVINGLIRQTRERRPVTSLVVTHDMSTVRSVADRVVMLLPLPRLGSGERQVIFDGTVDEVFASSNPRVEQFVRGQAGDRMQEHLMVEAG